MYYQKKGELVSLLVLTVIILVSGLFFFSDGGITGAVIGILPDKNVSEFNTNSTIVNETLVEINGTFISNQTQNSTSEIPFIINETTEIINESVEINESLIINESNDELTGGGVIEFNQTEEEIIINETEEVNLPEEEIINETFEINFTEVIINETINFTQINQTEENNTEVNQTSEENSSTFSLLGDYGILASPTHTTPFLNSTDPTTNGSSQNLTAFNQTTADGDSDIVKNIYNWFMNGTSLLVLNMPFEGVNLTSYNNSWDYSGYSNNGTENGTVTWSSSSGYDGRGAYDFDGVSGFLNLGNLSNLKIIGGNLTVEVWINATGRSGDGTINSISKVNYTLLSAAIGYDLFDNSDQFGVSVTSLGDVNGDGVPDLAVGASGDDDDVGGATSNRGTVYILFMNRTGGLDNTLNTPMFKLNETILAASMGYEPFDSSDGFGNQLAGMGDLNGDGVPDLAVGASGDDDNVGGGGSSNGAVYILFLNKSGGLNNKLNTSVFKINETKLAAFMGYNPIDNSDGFAVVGNIGDINGDGIVDLAIGATSDDDNVSGTENGNGAVYILFLNKTGGINNSLNTKVIKINETILANTLGFEPLNHSYSFGGGIAGLGDLNRDGVPDIAVGVGGDDDNVGGEGQTIGAIYILFLNKSGGIDNDLSTPVFEINETIIEDSIGYSPWESNDGLGGVTSLGDLNGDGVVDLAITAGNDDDNVGGSGTQTGAIYILFLNRTGGLKNSLNTSSFKINETNLALRMGFNPLDNGDLFGRSVSSMGDINGDGIVELAVGAGDDDGGSSFGSIFILTMNGTTGEVISKPGSYGINASNAYVTTSINSNTGLSGELVTHQWNHVVFTYNGIEEAIYVNGVLKLNRSLTGAIIENMINLTVGKRFNGTIDDLKIYNRTLSAEQISANYNNGSGRQDLIVSQETNIGDIWFVDITPNDGTSDGNTLRSNNVTIRDGEAPTVNFLVPSNGTNVSKNLQAFNASVIDNSGVSAVLFMFNTNTTPTNATTTNISGNWNVNVNVSSMQEGLHVVTVFTNDTFLNVNKAVNITLRVDRTSPTVNIVNSTFTTSNVTPSITFNFTDSAPSANCSLYINGTFSESNAVTANNTNTILTSTISLITRHYNFSVTCRDGSNNNGTAELLVEVNATEVTGCKTLSESGATYTLAKDISVGATGTCITVMNDSITLNCDNRNISFGEDASAITNVGGYDGITIKNCFIRSTCVPGEGCASPTGVAIFFNNSLNNLIQNNTFFNISARGINWSSSSDSFFLSNSLNTTISASYGAIGIYLDGNSSNNIFLNNTIHRFRYSIRDYTSGFNTLKYNNSFVQLIWNKTNISTNASLIIGTTVFISNNSIGIADNGNFSGLNGTTQVVFLNLPYADKPQLLKNGARCDHRDGECNITYNSGTGELTVTVIGFSNYSTQDRTVITSCQDLEAPIEYVLGDNLESAGTCINIFNDSVTLDCDSFYINYSVGSGGGGVGDMGINDTGSYDNIILKNCLINDKSAGLSSSDRYGIHFRDVSNSTVLNSTIISKSIDGYTSFLDSSSNNTFINNTHTNLALDGGDPASGRGVAIFLNGTSTGNKFTSENVTANQYPLRILNSSEQNLFLNSNFTLLVTAKLVTPAVIDDIHTSSGTNSLIYNNSFGMINWTKTNLTTNVSVLFSQNVFILNNLVGYTVELLSQNLNGSAKIEIRSLSFVNTPRLLKNGVRCDNETTCNITYNSGLGILFANISSFSNYTTQSGAAPTQGTPILNTTNLARNDTNENLTAHNVSTADVDNNLVRNIYNWYVNGTSLTVLNMPFEGINSSNSNNAYDYSGFRNNGTNGTGVFWNSTGGYDGKGAYHFTGTGNNYITVGNATPENTRLVCTGGCTMSAWIFVPPTSANVNRNIVSRRIDTPTQDNNFIRFHVGSPSLLQTLNLIIYQNGSTDSPSCNTFLDTWPIQNNTWTHVTGRYNLTHVSLFVNGTQKSRTACSFSNVSAFAWKDGNEPIRIGAASSTEKFNGTIDEVLIFNRSLSDEQILALYNNQTNLIHSNDTNTGETWFVDVTPNDGGQDGNTSRSNNVTILDVTIPTVSILNPVNGSNHSNNEVQSFNASVIDTEAGVEAVLFQMSNGSNPFNTTATNVSGNWGVTINISNLVEGTHTVTVFANDTSNNMNKTENISIIVDRTGAIVNILNSSFVTFNLTPSVNFNFTDLSVSTNCSLYLNGNFNVSNTATVNDTNTILTVASALNAGSYITTVNCTDGSGNVGNSSAITIVINNVSTHSTPILNTTNPLKNSTLENLTAYNVSTTDVDNNLVKNIYNWYVNGTSLAVLNIVFEKINGTIGNNTWDYSGYSNNASEQNGTIALPPTWNATAGFDGRGAYEFNSTSASDGNYLSLSNRVFMHNATNWSVSFWAYATAQNWNGVLGGPLSSQGNLLMHSTQVCYELTTDCVAIGVFQNIWTYIVLVAHENSSIEVYRDGSKQGILESLTNSSFDMHFIGRGSSRYFNGTLDEIVVWNRSLSEEQILALYNNRTDLVVSQELQGSDVWFVDITPNDGQEDGSTLRSNNVSVIVDTVPPQVTINYPTNGSNLTNTNDFNATVIETFLDVSRVVVQFSNGTNTFNRSATNTSGIWNVTFDVFEKLSEGIHVVTFFSNDTLNNMNKTENISIIVDRTGATVNLINSSFNTTNTTPFFTFNFTDISISANCTLYMDSVHVASNSSTVNNTNTILIASTQVDGTFVTTVNCTDGSGNIGNSTPINITIDRTGPTVSMINSSFNTTDTTPSFSFNFTDLSISTNCTLYMNSVHVASNSSAANNTNTILTASTHTEGTYVTTVNCTDGSGNVGNSTALSIGIDTASPSVFMLNSTFSTTSDNTPTIHFNYTDLSSIANCTLYMNDVNVASNSSIINSTNSTLTPTSSLSNGVYVTYVNCTDSVGSVGNSSSINVTVSITAPGGGGGSGSSSSSPAGGGEAKTTKATTTKTTTTKSITGNTLSANDVSNLIAANRITVNVETTSTGERTSSGGGSGTTSRKLEIFNGGDKLLKLSANIDENVGRLENNENVEKLLEEQWMEGDKGRGLTAEEIRRLIIEEAKALEIIEFENIQQIYKGKTASLFDFIPSSITGSAVYRGIFSKVSPIRPTGEHISANLLKSRFVDRTLEDIIVKPGDTFEGEIRIKRGLSKTGRNVDVAFTAEGQEVLRKGFGSQKVDPGTAIDIDTDKRHIEIYMLIPAGGDKTRYNLEIIINEKKESPILFGGKVLSAKISSIVPIRKLTSRTKTVYNEFYGPFNIDERGALIAVQQDYDRNALNGEYEIISKIYDEKGLVSTESSSVKFK